VTVCPEDKGGRHLWADLLDGWFCLHCGASYSEESKK
jgi:hypothetical protein